MHSGKEFKGTQHSWTQKEIKELKFYLHEQEKEGEENKGYCNEVFNQQVKNTWHSYHEIIGYQLFPKFQQLQVDEADGFEQLIVSHDGVYARNQVEEFKTFKGILNFQYSILQILDLLHEMQTNRNCFVQFLDLDSILVAGER